MITLVQIDERYVIPDKKQFLIDTEDDMAELESEAQEAAPGSFAYNADLTIIYQLGNDRIWHKIIL